MLLEGFDFYLHILCNLIMSLFSFCLGCKIWRAYCEAYGFPIIANWSWISVRLIFILIYPLLCVKMLTFLKCGHPHINCEYVYELVRSEERRVGKECVP